MFVFLLAVAIAYPLLGFNALHATSIFVMSLGMAEQDGLAVVLGVIAGVLSLALIAVSGTSVRALRSQFVRWLRKIGRRFGLNALADFLDRLGYKKLASILAFEWSQLLWIWNPEQRPVERVQMIRVAGHGPPRNIAMADTPAGIANRRGGPLRLAPTLIGC